MLCILNSAEGGKSNEAREFMLNEVYVAYGAKTCDGMRKCLEEQARNSGHVEGEEEVGGEEESDKCASNFGIDADEVELGANGLFASAPAMLLDVIGAQGGHAELETAFDTFVCC
ncbi:hypothetical protein Cyrtocomes_01115 [Candidatus Cyrtobacter comes]|uniref:Phycocyanin alpha subunit n=2 Tax=Candidatus Cyrtobacter comes TaxID=675776 RepID=A0ABU5L9B7_9RICK|nr:hypothetical protein [Candidatus Cyrtobacter comes]